MSWRMTFANLRSEVCNLVSRLVAFKLNEGSSGLESGLRAEPEERDQRERPECQ